MFLFFQSKVIRVLNLWQKNNIFDHETLDPVFDMADPNHPKFKEVAAIVAARLAAKPPPAEKKAVDTVQTDSVAPAPAQKPVASAGPATSVAVGSKDLNSRIQQLSHIFGAEVPPEAKPAELQMVRVL